MVSLRPGGEALGRRAVHDGRLTGRGRRGGEGDVVHDGSELPQVSLAQHLHQGANDDAFAALVSVSLGRREVEVGDDVHRRLIEVGDGTRAMFLVSTDVADDASVDGAPVQLAQRELAGLVRVGHCRA